MQDKRNEKHDVMSESEKNANLFAFDERRYY